MSEYKKGVAAPHIIRKASQDYYQRNREHINEVRRSRYAQLTPEQRRIKNGRKVHGERQRAGNQLRYAIAAGKIIRPDACSQCGATGKIEAHHTDYSKPLDVQWLCRDCHGLTRRKRDALLAAAPDLLGLLIEMRDELSPGQTGGNDYHDAWQVFGEKIEELIAKAEGRWRS